MKALILIVPRGLDSTQLSILLILTAKKKNPRKQNLKCIVNDCDSPTTREVVPEVIIPGDVQEMRRSGTEEHD